MLLEEKLLNKTMEAGDEIGASNSVDHNHMKISNVPRGGYIACLFVFAQNGLDSIGFVANVASIVLYFSKVMHFDNSGSANTFTNYLGTASLVSVVGAVISDSYMNRLNTTLLFGGFQLLGYILLIIQAHYKKLQPEKCNKYSCVHGIMALLFYASTTFAALGGGGIRGVVPALGADQFNKNDPKENKHIASYFNWFLFSSTVGSCFGVTVVVWISSNKGWDRAFLLSLLCSFTGLFILAVGKPLYRVRVPGESAVIRVTQVLFVALRNRKVKLPQNSCDLYEIRESESGSVGEQIRHTDQFRLLDKSAVLPEGVTPKNWTVCTVTQVEEVKVLTRMMPILLSTILLNTCLGQLQTFSVQQGNHMNSKFGKFKVPSPSIPIIPLAFMSILVPLYETIFVPMVRKFTGHPNGITHLQRVGVGLVLCVISMGIAGVIEVKRKKELLHNNHCISLFWLSYHFAIFGIADMFTFIGLMEFFYSEAPQGMRSLSTSFTYLSSALGYYMSSILVEIINLVSSKLSSSKKGWLEGSDLNKNRLEYFYWFLAILSLLNFGNYVFWANWYKYKEDVPIDKQNSKN